MNRLTEIGIKHNTDKATYHRFTDLYDQYFRKYVKPRILEIGVDKGNSIRMLKEYYNSMCSIVAVDIFDKTGIINDNDIEFVKADQSKRGELEKIQGKFDIIIEDGGHFMEQQMVSLAVLLPKLNAGGVYICEDLHTSFPNKYYGKFVPDNCTITTFQYLFDIQNSIIRKSNYITDAEDEYIRKRITKVRFFNSKANILNDSLTAILQ